MGGRNRQLTDRIAGEWKKSSLIRNPADQKIVSPYQILPSTHSWEKSLEKTYPPPRKGENNLFFLDKSNFFKDISKFFVLQLH